MSSIVNQKISENYFSSYSSVEDDYFQLPEDFINQYRGRKPNFGFNGLGEIVYYRTYSRLKADNSKENFEDTLRRVTEGTYEIQRRHCKKLHIPWSYDKAVPSAMEMFQRMWDFKFLPPGRGLWMMGTEFMWSRGSAALNNCAMISTNNIDTEPAEPFCFMMDMSMLGVGVGFDTKGANKLLVRSPYDDTANTFVIGDSRESWVESLRLLIESYTKYPNLGYMEFEYDHIRPAGSDIKGFGGKASGAQILISLHNSIRQLLESRIDRYLTSVDITDLMNIIGKCVVAGNVRRTAQITFGEYDDNDYINMKNPVAGFTKDEVADFYKVTTKLYDIDRYVAVYGDFEDTCIKGDKLDYCVKTWNYLNAHRWASNNSIVAHVGMDYTKYAASIAVNGEPGFIWLDNMRDYGRMIDGFNPGVDGRAVGSNPCLAGSNKLLTANGYIQLIDLWLQSGMQEYNGLTDNPILKYGSQNVVNRNGVVEATKVYRTGQNIDLWRVIFDDNSYVDATANHNFIKLNKKSIRINGKKRVRYNENRVHLNELSVGDMVPLNQTVHFGTYRNTVYAELAGWCIGDGSLSPKSDGQVRAECTCYESDVENVLPRITALLTELYYIHNKSSVQSPAYAGWHRDQEHFDHDEVRVGSNVLGRMLKNDGIVNGNKHAIPSSIWNGDRETISAFIKGLASADGCVLISDNGTISVRINQSNRDLLSDCRLLLNQFNIASTVQFRKSAGKQLMNDGNGGRKLYNRKANWELIISGMKQVTAFLDQIGFIQDWKSINAREWLSKHCGSNNSDTGKYVKVKSIEYIGKQDTFCLTEPINNQIVINGYQIGQCSEQTLEDHELCTLVETFPANHESSEDYMRTLKYAYLYGKTVTLLPTHNPRTNQVMLRNRRIGLSQSGIVQAIAKFGRRKLLRDFCDNGYKEIKHWDNIYSEWLCVNGSIKVTSVKPSGSVSLVAGATPGIHYPEAKNYWRRMRLSKDSILVDILKDAGYHIEPMIGDPNTMVAKFAISDERVKPVEEVSMYSQMALASDYQAYWADNQVSCTIKFKKEEAHTLAEVCEVFEDKLKGISFLPHTDHGYQQAPYEPCTREEVIEYNSKIKQLDFSSFINEAIGSKFCDGDKCELA
jgi:intein/homing endonuclease